MERYDCYDCIHCGTCSDAGDPGISYLEEDVSKCKHFANKTDFVEVVRCKDCKHLEKDEGLREGRMCLIRGKAGWCHDNDFCSYGERRDT